MLWRVRALLLLLSSFATAPAAAEAVNRVAGDASFVARFGHMPSDTTPEPLRIATHLAFAEQQLRAAGLHSLTLPQRIHRAKLLDALARYRKAGRFPQNDRPGARRPRFVDPDGRRCAVAHLIESSGHAALMWTVQRQHEWEHIAEMRTRGLASWAHEHGVTLEELALIQPTYGWQRRTGPGHTEPRTRNQANLDGLWQSAQPALDACVEEGRMAEVVTRVRLPAAKASHRIRVRTEVVPAGSPGTDHAPTESELACMRHAVHQLAQELLGWLTVGPELTSEWHYYAANPPLISAVQTGSLDAAVHAADLRGCTWHRRESLTIQIEIAGSADFSPSFDVRVRRDLYGTTASEAGGRMTDCVREAVMRVLEPLMKRVQPRDQPIRAAVHRNFVPR